MQIKFLNEQIEKSLSGTTCSSTKVSDTSKNIAPPFLSSNPGIAHIKLAATLQTYCMEKVHSVIQFLSTKKKDMNPLDKLPHPLYFSDLVPDSFHLFGPINYHSGGKRFLTNMEVKDTEHQWLRSPYKGFFLRAGPQMAQMHCKVKGLF